jgi:short-subunit dehydrogenase
MWGINLWVAADSPNGYIATLRFIQEEVERFIAAWIVLCKLQFFSCGSGRIIALSSGSGHIIALNSGYFATHIYVLLAGQSL